MARLRELTERLAAQQERGITPEEKQHAEMFGRWLRSPTDTGVKSALEAVESDLRGRALLHAEQKFQLAQRRCDEAIKTFTEAATPGSKRPMRVAEVEVIRARCALEDAQKKYAVKDVTIGDGPAGGFALPAILSAEVDRQAVVFNPFRRLVRTEQCSSSDYAFLVETPDTGSGWVGETGTRTQTDTPNLRELKPAFGEVYAYARASGWAVDDIFFNVEAWLARSAAVQFSRQETLAIVRGTGSGQPSGFLNTAPSTAGDDDSPDRNQASLQYFTPEDSPGNFGVDALIDLSHSVADEYLEEIDAVAWVMRRSTLAQIRKLKSQDGAPILLEAAGQRPLLLGWPVELTGAMDAAGVDSPVGYPIAFGNWRKGYGLADRGAIKITADAVTQPGHVRYYLRRRVGGVVTDNHAIKLLSI